MMHGQTHQIETDVYLAFIASDSKSVLVYEEVESGSLGRPCYVQVLLNTV